MQSKKYYKDPLTLNICLLAFRTITIGHAIVSLGTEVRCHCSYSKYVHNGLSAIQQSLNVAKAGFSQIMLQSISRLHIITVVAIPGKKLVVLGDP